MNIVAFPVGTTNIFPIANSVNGGQLLTEFNMKSRESVDTPSEIKYIVGHSYTHSMDDFAVSIQQDNVGVTISSSCLEIAPGRAVINGHYVESLAPIVIDMLEANKQLLTVTDKQLYGDLAIGLRMMYSTEKTLAGSLRVENSDNYFEGIHVVILPVNEFILPQDSPNDESKVTAHLLLAKFHYTNGTIYESSIIQNSDKIKNIAAERIGDVDKLLSANYLSASGLDPSKLYVLSGAEDVEDGGVPRPTWQNATGSLIKWDSDHTKPVVLPPGEKLSDVTADEVNFEQYWDPETGNNKIRMRLPHLVNAKNYLWDSHGNRVYYPDKLLDIPNADFLNEDAGLVNKDYTQRIKSIEEKINNFYNVLGGNMLAYLDHLNDRSELPPLPLYKNKLSTYQSKATVDGLINQLTGSVEMLKSKLEHLRETVDDLISKNSTVIELTSFKNVFQTYVDEYRNKDNELASEIEVLSNRLTEHIARGEGSSTSDDYSIEPITSEELDTISDSAIKKIAQDHIQTVEIVLSEILPRVVDLLNTYSGDLDDEKGSRILDLEAFRDEFETTVRPQIDELIQWKEQFDLNIPESIRNYIDTKFDVEVGTVEEYKNQIMEAVSDGIKGLADKYQLSRQGVNPGDYVIVGQDMTVDLPDGYDGRYPTTMYIARIGNCTGATFVYKIGPTYFTDTNREEGITLHKRMLPDNLLLQGTLLNEVEVDVDNFTPPEEFNSEAPQDVLDLLEVSNYSGYVMHDYFAVRAVTRDDYGNIDSMTSYIYRASGNLDDELVWSDPVWITTSIPMATESVVGGFLNVSSDAYGQGYVIRDDYGNLRLLDYDLLALGVLSYQLGEDYQTPSGADVVTIQNELDSYVNYRVCFPNSANVESGQSYPNTINVTVDLSVSEQDDGNSVVTIQNIDSRFGTALYVHLVGKVTNTTIIELKNIEKLKLDISSLEGTCAINLYNCGLCYDATVLNALTHIEGLSLWYQKYEDEDPDILVDGMTVELVNHSGIATSEDYWSEVSGGDYLFNYAIKSVTFGDDGSILRLGLFISDDSTPNITTTFQEGYRIFGASFKAPQSLGLPYPGKLFRKQIKISGAFITSYYSAELGGYVVKDNTFTALTQKYDSTVGEVYGTISIYSKFSLVTNAIIRFNDMDESVGASIDGWAPGKFHVFYGGTID